MSKVEIINNRASKDDSLSFLRKTDISDLLERSKSHKDFTIEELALISYNANKWITKYTYPQLFSWVWRLYTIDLPVKIVQYFNVKHNLDPNEFWFIEKNRVNLLEWFLAENWIIRRTHNWWCEVYEEYEYATEIALKYLINDLAGWAINQIYNPSAVALILWNISEYSNKIKLETFWEGIKVKEELDLDSLTTEELLQLAENPSLLRKKFKSLWYWEDQEPIEWELEEIIDDNNKD